MNKNPQNIKPQKNSLISELISWVVTIVCAIILMLVIKNYIIINAKVPTPSMEPTINTGDRLFANRLSYLFSEPERFDIVVFKFPDDESILYIKRIIGLPGDTVEIIEGDLYVNDELLEEDYIAEPMIENDFGPYEVPEGHYFMLGDNRNISADSRYWENKYVSFDQILGKAFIKYYPKIELLTNK